MIEATLEIAFQYIEISKLITIVICDISSLQETAMKVKLNI